MAPRAPRIYPVVLAGGSGTRFWPASRRARPKPFATLLSNRTLIETTVERLRALAPARDITVVCSDELAALARRTLRSQRGVRFALEPAARNTAAAIVWAAARLEGSGADGVLGVFPADHHIPRPAAFVRAVRAAARAAADGERLVLIGIEPTRPDPAYGYLKLGPGRGAVRPVARFVEKPRPATARRYLAGGAHLWNAGMLLARPRRILDEARRHAPEIWEAAGGMLERVAAGRRVAASALARAYRRITPISFDYAVLERSRRVWALRGRFAWSDLGSWDALAEHLPVAGGNRVGGRSAPLTLDATDNVVWNETDKTLVLLGVSDLIVVQADDALLICSKERAQDVRQVIGALERGRRRDLT